MAIKNLLKSQSNEVYLALVEAGWDASQFEWLEVKSPNYGSSTFSPQLNHKLSGYYFIFDNHGEFHSKFSPGFQNIEQRESATFWLEQIKIFKEWLKLLSREVNIPDLWSELPSDSKLIESTSEATDNSKFNAEEKEAIKKGLEEIKKYLLTAHKLDLELIEGQLKYLVESSERLGRKDWKNTLIAVIFSIIIQGGIAGHNAQEIFQFVWTVLNTVLIHKMYLP
jgi:hypothetical protein